MSSPVASSTSSNSSAPMDMELTNAQSEAPKYLRVFEVFSWENTQSNLIQPHPVSNRIPPATDLTSAFLDLQKTPKDLDGRHIAEAIPEEAIGTKFRAD